MKKLLLLIFLFVSLHCLAEPSQTVIDQNIQAAKKVFNSMYNNKDDLKDLIEWNRFMYFDEDISAELDTMKTTKEKQDLKLAMVTNFKTTCDSLDIAEKDFYDWRYWKETSRGIAIIGQIHQYLMYFYMHTDEKGHILLEEVNYDSGDDIFEDN